MNTQANLFLIQLLNLIYSQFKINQSIKTKKHSHSINGGKMILYVFLFFLVIFFSLPYLVHIANTRSLRWCWVDAHTILSTGSHPWLHWLPSVTWQSRWVPWRERIGINECVIKSLITGVVRSRDFGLMMMTPTTTMMMMMMRRRKGRRRRWLLPIITYFSVLNSGKLSQ